MSLKIVKWHIRSRLLHFLLFYVTAFGESFLKEGKVSYAVFVACGCIMRIPLQKPELRWFFFGSDEI